MSDELKQESGSAGGQESAGGGPSSPASSSQPPVRLETACDCAGQKAHLIDELAEAKALAEENLNGWKRAMADYANLKKEAEAARAEMSKFACVSLVAELLPVLDSFRRAAAEKPSEAEKLAQWAEGMNRIRDQFESVMRKAGVEAIDKTGVAFDPNIHEAVSTRQAAGIPPDQVVEVMAAGYRMHERVIRAAKVVVSS